MAKRKIRKFNNLPKQESNKLIHDYRAALDIVNRTQQLEKNKRKTDIPPYVTLEQISHVNRQYKGISLLSSTKKRLEELEEKGYIQTDSYALSLTLKGLDVVNPETGYRPLKKRSLRDKTGRTIKSNRQCLKQQDLPQGINIKSSL